MVRNSERKKIKEMIRDTLMLLVKNGVTFNDKFSVEALIGITVDEDDVVLVSINELIESGRDKELSESDPIPEKKKHKSKRKKHYQADQISEDDAVKRQRYEEQTDNGNGGELELVDNTEPIMLEPDVYLSNGEVRVKTEAVDVDIEWNDEQSGDVPQDPEPLTFQHDMLDPGTSHDSNQMTAGVPYPQYGASFYDYSTMSATHTTTTPGKTNTRKRQCPYCTKELHPTAYNRHVREKHQNHPWFVCPIWGCTMKKRRKEQVKLHLVKEHNMADEHEIRVKMEGLRQELADG